MLRKLFAATLACLLLAPAATATWSIVLVNIRTGEIAIGSATCVAGLDLKQWSPVLVVGRGGGAAQSVVDQTVNNRRFIRDELLKGTSPAAIIAGLARRDGGHQGRQYGIVDTLGRAIGFTGTQAAAWAGHVTGRVGDVVYAIQGNILTGAAVVGDAETAIRNTPGDLGTKLMAAMEAARLQGGDKRCNPTASSDIGYIVIARQGDTDGGCDVFGCVTGDYYLCLNAPNSNPIDPVLVLKMRFDAWRISMQGRPDHHLSSVEVPPVVPADATTAVRARLVLRDLENMPLTGGGASVSISLDAASTASVLLGDVKDNGDGSYGFTVTGAATEGTALLRIVVDDGIRKVLLSPRTPIQVSKDPLWRSTPAVPWATGGNVDFLLHPGAAAANRPYLLLASNSGSVPGMLVAPGVVLPLNRDSVMEAFFYATVFGQLPSFAGQLDADGRARASLALPGGVWGVPLGTQLTFAYALFNPLDTVSNPVGVHLGQ